MNEQDIMNLLNFAKELPYLKDIYDQLVKDVDDLDYKKSKIKEELAFLQNEELKLRKTLKWYQSELDSRTKEVSKLNLKKEID